MAPPAYHSTIKRIEWRPCRLSTGALCPTGMRSTPALMWRRPKVQGIQMRSRQVPSKISCIGWPVQSHLSVPSKVAWSAGCASVLTARTHMCVNGCTGLTCRSGDKSFGETCRVGCRLIRCWEQHCSCLTCKTSASCVKPYTIPSCCWQAGQAPSCCPSVGRPPQLRPGQTCRWAMCPTFARQVLVAAIDAPMLQNVGA